MLNDGQNAIRVSSPVHARWTFPSDVTFDVDQAQKVFQREKYSLKYLAWRVYYMNNT